MKEPISYEVCISVRRLNADGWEVDDSGNEIDAIFKRVGSFESYDTADRFVREVEKNAGKMYAKVQWREDVNAIRKRELKNR